MLLRLARRMPLHSSWSLPQVPTKVSSDVRDVILHGW